MGLWTLYFTIKFFLYYRGYIRLDVLWNLLFFAFLMLPTPKRFASVKVYSVAKISFSMIAGILLVWHDSWLPAPIDAVRLLKQYGMPGKEYVYQFLLRFYDPMEFLMLAAIIALCVMLRKYTKITAAATVVLLILPLFLSAGEAKHRASEDAGEQVGSFTNAEMTRLIYFKPSKSGNRDFDIIILHVCSLAWDDLQALSMDGRSFFQQFDYLFTNFNSVTTYSNPSAIRLLNANCGQRRHDDLYTTIPKECSLMESLRAQGNEIQFARNHNGKYGKFDEEVKRFGHLDAIPFTPAGLPAEKYMFDDSPVYGDYAVLEQWWTKRQTTKSKKVVLYYNTVSLHDGTHWVNDKDWWKRDQKEQYREFVQALLGDLTRFFQLVAASGRDAIIIFVPEHGRAVRGSAIVPPGLRDIPLPRITTVPVGIKLMGKGYHAGPANKQITISKPTSYLALAYMLAAFTEESPFQSDRYLFNTFLDSIPQTAFVAENEKNLVVKRDGEYFYYGKDEKWTRLSDNELK